MVIPVSPGTFPLVPVDPSPAEPPAPSAPKRGDRRPGGDSLQRDYAILVQNYRLTAGFDGTHFPLEAFSLHQGKVLVTYQDRNGARKQAFLTEELLQRLFRQRGIPYEKGAARRFMTALRTLLETWDLSPWEMALRKLTREGHPEAAAWFRDLLPRTLSFDGHLIALGEEGPETAAPFAGEFSQRAMERFGLTPAEYRGLIQALKQELARQGPPADGPETVSLKSFDLLYTHPAGALALRLDKKTGAPELLDRPVAYRHSQKTIPLPRRVPRQARGEAFLAPLAALTGGDPEVLDQLAGFLAWLAAPTARPPQIAVVYTRANHRPLRTILTQVLAGKVLEGAVPKLLQSEGRKDLLSAQTRGLMAVLPEESLPTPSQAGDFVTLIQGGRLPAKDKLVPSQAFHSQMPLVYLTGNEKLVETLLQRYQVRLVDLTAVETLLPPDTALTEEEIAWIRGCLLPWGCRVNRRTAPRRKTAEPEGAPVPDAQLTAFLTRCCRVAPDQCCSRGELYEAYAAWHMDHQGTPPEETPTLFGKRVRRQNLAGVEYKVKRYGPDKGTQLCYVGLGILPEPLPPARNGGEDSAVPFAAWVDRVDESCPLPQA